MIAETDSFRNVGPFKYYSMNQIPNFVLASPILLISCCGIHHYLAAFSFSHPRKGTGYLQTDILDFVLHWLFLVSVSLVVMHVQVSTRFIASQCPPLYWFSAFKLQTHPRLIFWYFVGYFVVGTVLFTNFYPWTWPFQRDLSRKLEPSNERINECSLFKVTKKWSS